MLRYGLLMHRLAKKLTHYLPKIAEIKNEWMRQWARTVLIVERLLLSPFVFEFLNYIYSFRSISPGDRLKHQNRYCDIDTQVGLCVLNVCTN